MLLRDHPLKSRHGVPNWPPLETWINKLENTRPKTEIGVLKSQAAELLQFCRNRYIADIGLANSFPLVLRLLKKERKAKGGKKTWKQNKK
jgi:hypothetical protein